MYASLYLCCIRVGVHIAVAHRGDIAKSSKNLVAKSVSCIQFFAFSAVAWDHPHSLRGVCAGVVVEIWASSLL